MLKKLLTKLVLLVAVVLMGASSAWAADKTNISTVTTSFSATGDVNDKFTQTGDFTSASWNLNVTWKNSESWQNMNSTKGSQVGSGSKPASSIVLTGSNIPGTIKSVVVNSSVASEGSTTVGVVVGNTTFKCNNQNTATLQTSATDYTFTGTGSGDVVLTWTQASTSKAIYIKSVTITYAEASGLTPIATIDDMSDVTLNINATGTFSRPTITPATGAVESTDYEVEWSSSNSGVLTVDTSTGEYIAGSAQGTATITMTVEPYDDTIYEAVSTTFTVTVIDPNAPGTVNNPYTVAQAIANTPSSGTSANVYIKGIVSKFQNADIVSDGSNYRYYISDDGSTTNQLLVYKGKKNATEDFSSADDLLIEDEVIIFGGLTTYSNTKEVAAGNYIVSRKTKADPALSFSETSYTCDLTKAFSAPALISASGFDGDPVYVSSNTGVATVNSSTGAVTLIAVGTTTISVTSAATGNFKAGSASYELTVTANEGVDPVAPASSAGYYVLVTDASTLAEGDQIIIAYANDEVAMSTEQKSSNRGATTITVNSNGTITATDATQVIKLEGATGAWYFNVGKDDKENNLYLYASSNSSNQLKTAALSTTGAAAKATIVIANNGTATIKFQRENGRNWLRYNPNNGSPLFACYANDATGSEPQIYRYVAGTPTNTQTVQLSAYGYKTLVATENFTVIGATAYIVTAANTTGVTMTSIDVVPAGAPVILKGTANNEATLTFTTDDASDVTANLLAVSAAGINYDDNYVLAKKGDDVGFYLWSGGSLGAGRVYLPAANVTNGSTARSFLPFNFGEATGISTIDHSSLTIDHSVYNLNGQRVDSPKKGLYIVNGKKMILK